MILSPGVIAVPSGVSKVNMWHLSLVALLGISFLESNNSKCELAECWEYRYFCGLVTHFFSVLQSTVLLRSLLSWIFLCFLLSRKARTELNRVAALFRSKLIAESMRRFNNNQKVVG